MESPNSVLSTIRKLFDNVSMLEQNRLWRKARICRRLDTFAGSTLRYIINAFGDGSHKFTYDDIKMMFELAMEIKSFIFADLKLYAATGETVDQFEKQQVVATKPILDDHIKQLLLDENYRNHIARTMDRLNERVLELGHFFNDHITKLGAGENEVVVTGIYQVQVDVQQLLTEDIDDVHAEFQPLVKLIVDGLFDAQRGNDTATVLLLVDFVNAFCGTSLEPSQLRSFDDFNALKQCLLQQVDVLIEQSVMKSQQKKDFIRTLEVLLQEAHTKMVDGNLNNNCDIANLILTQVKNGRPIDNQAINTLTTVAGLLGQNDAQNIIEHLKSMKASTLDHYLAATHSVMSELQAMQYEGLNKSQLEDKLYRLNKAVDQYSREVETLRTYHTKLVCIVFDDSTIRDAIRLWCDQREIAMAKYGHISQWNVSMVTNMNDLFYNLIEFNDDISNWDVSKVECMRRMFYGAIHFNQPLDKWNVGKVSIMTNMFENAQSFNQSINSWNVSNVVSMKSLFKGALAFNQPLQGWDTSNVTQLASLFENAKSFNQPLGIWKTGNAINMRCLFAGTPYNQPLNGWDVRKVTDMGSMFHDATIFNQSLENWDVRNVTTMESMFRNACAFNQVLVNWNISKCHRFEHMFEFAKSFNQSLHCWNIAEDSNIHNMFDVSYPLMEDLKTWVWYSVILAKRKREVDAEEEPRIIKARMDQDDTTISV